MFSSRLPSALTENALGRAVAAKRARGEHLIDLTETNPTAVGLEYPAGVIEALRDPGALTYVPDPLGLRSARAAVAGAYEARGRAVDPDRLVLTASTSEAYALLFKLLTDTGDEVLVPQPSYPLFEMLTRLEGVRAAPYQLDPFGGWSIDRESIERALTPAARAILVVSPNNPTGSILRKTDRDWLAGLAAGRGLAIIADEVFEDYPLTPRPDASSFLGETRALTFTLGGLSKSAGLPQMKLGWIVVSGPPAMVGEAIARLALIADTYLSVSTPVQLAATRLIDAGRQVRRVIAARLAQNLGQLRSALDARPSLGLIDPEGGWSAVIQVPSIMTEEQMTLRLVEDVSVLVHPGYFFDFPREAFLVLSLLPEPAAFAEGLARVLPLVAGDYL